MARIRQFHLPTSHNCLTRQPISLILHRQPFSTTSAQYQKNRGTNAKKLKKLTENVPPYPYKPSRWYKQSNFGLYARARVRFGNNVGESEFKTKTRRTWHPNVQHHKFYSWALDRSIPLKVTTRVMRSIDKVGGLDNYLLGEKPARIKDLGPMGWVLRWQIMQTPEIQARWDELREKYGLEKTLDAEMVALKEAWDAEIASTPSVEQKQLKLKQTRRRKDVMPKIDWYIFQWNKKLEAVRLAIEAIQDRMDMYARIFAPARETSDENAHTS